MRSPYRGLEKLEMNTHLQLEASWKAEKEEKIQENRTKQAFDAATWVYKPQKVEQVGAKRRHILPRVDREVITAPQRFKMNKARNGDLKTAARFGGEDKVTHQTEFPKAELS